MTLFAVICVHVVEKTSPINEFNETT